MRTLTAIAICGLLTSLPTHAEAVLRLSHLQHLYAGGGACAERFWLEWRDSKSEIRNIALTIEIQSKGEESLTETLRVERIGVSTADNAAEATIETARCLSGHPRLVVRAATASIGGKQINLLTANLLRIGMIERLPLTISGPTRRSRGTPAGKPAAPLS
jgi:hypothetical protein